MKVEANLQALSVLVVKGKGPGSEDESLAVQHAVLPHHNLHEGLAATEVQERPLASICDNLSMLGRIIRAVDKYSQHKC